MNNLRARFSRPGLKGALFYAAFWGVVGLYEPYINIYFLRSGITPQQIGWLAAVLPLGVMVIAPLVSRLADRTRRRVIFLAVGVLGFGAALTLPGWPFFRPAFLPILGFVALFAVFRSPIIALADSLIASMATRHALDFGRMRLWGSLAYTTTALLMGAVWQRAGFETMFRVTGASFLAVALVALLLEEVAASSDAVASPDTAALVEAAVSGDAVGRPRLVLAPGIASLLAATFLLVAALFMAGTFVSVYLTQLGVSESLVGAAMGFGALGEVPGMLFGARIARKVGPTSALLTGYLLIAAGFLGSALIPAPAPQVVCAAARGMGFGVMLVSTVMTINTRSPRSLASTYMGILNAACWGLAPLLGGPISGWIFQSFGAPALFFTSATMTGLACLAILPTYAAWRKPQPAAQEPARLAEPEL